MRKIISRVFEFGFFIVIILLLFCKISWIFRANDNVSRENIVGFKNQTNIDVVLCGGSNIFRYYQPMEAWHQKGYTSYNYATSSARADLLKEYLEESRLTNEATLYVCDIRTIPLIENTIVEQSLRNWSDSVSVFSPIRLGGISSFLFTRDWREWDIVSFYIDIAKYHSNYESLGDAYQWSYINKKNIDSINKGFEPNKDHYEFDEPPIYNERGDLTKQQEKALAKLLDYCDKERLKVLFIVCPYIITESDWKILNTCGDIIQSRGYSYINFNNYYDEIGLEFETDFGDTNHVNYLGAEKYTSYLMDYILEHCELPDHRDDATYAKWDSDYIAYKASQAEWKESIVSKIDRHLEAKEQGKKLKYIDDFSSWYENIQNDNYTIIVTKNKYFESNSEDKVFNRMLSDWKIDMTQPAYIGLWSGSKCQFSSNEDEEYETNIGVNGGYGKVKCSLSMGQNPQILIDSTNYYQDIDGIQVVVFDNNYHEIIDNVIIWVDDKEGIKLIR